jgi:Mor family transcriptional regulator
MTEFRTSLEKLKPEFQISLNSKILTLGSCFSDVLGNYLVNNKVDCLANPFGNVYNISSIANIIANSILPTEIEEDAVVENDGVFFHYDYHSEIRDFNKDRLFEKIETLDNKTASYLELADFLIITLGTSWVYEKKQNQKIVSNCHKQNAALFNKRLLDEKEQLDIFENIYENIKAINPRLKIILTISPVRHVKDTLQLNSVSKSILRTLCYRITQTYSDTYYFPSYEIMMDDLRDYRFYKSDLIHPNELAEQYILSIFSEAYFDKNLKIFMADWKKLKAAIDHRPFNPAANKHQEFLKTLLKKIQVFENQIDISKEMETVQSQII